MRGMIPFVFSCLVAARGAFAQTQDRESAAGQPLSAGDKDFPACAAEDNRAGIEACLPAGNRAATYALKAFARPMADGHGQIASRLAALASAENFDPPTGAGEEGEKTMAELTKLGAANFDRPFMHHRIEDREHGLKRFEEIQARTRKGRVRHVAAETAPVPQRRLALAKAVETPPAGRAKRASRR
jgi:predicted outer membrane protein